MRVTSTSGKLLGVVQVRVGSRTFAVPVQAIVFDRDVGTTPAGGFFVEGDQLGILVDESAPDVDDQIKRATEDAVRHLSLKILN
jgi:hypothetical protein